MEIPPIDPTTDRWPRVSQCATNMRHTADTTLPVTIPWVQKYKDSKFIVAISVSIIIFAFLFIVRPPYVCRRKPSPIDSTQYTETLSYASVTAWAVIAGTLVFLGNPLIQLLNRVSQVG